MSKGKMRECKSCGKEISAKGKVTCPECGAVNKKAIYKRAWFIILAVLIIMGVLDSGIEVTEVNIGELYDELEDNALKASNTYKGKYIQTTGKLSSIDSSGGYFTLEPLGGDYMFQSLHCHIKEKHLEQVMEFNSGQEVTIKGKVTMVGEFLGYSVDVEVIE